jgi:eukaryotic-like serine/threonine-protein kinase
MRRRRIAGCGGPGTWRPGLIEQLGVPTRVLPGDTYLSWLGRLRGENGPSRYVWWGLDLVSELQPGDPQSIGPYRLVGQLGQGGMGRVYLGVSPGGRPVAVKAIRAELAADSDFRRRFGREVAAARRVSGVFTAQVVDADIDGPVAWMATAYVPGPSLEEAVDTHGPLPETSLLALAAGLAESLNAIHVASVVHRDLKPSNVLLAEDGPRVIDFGISRAAESTMLTQAGLVVGSPGFMSPEQAMGHEVGPPSDVFNFGAVLSFAATGQGPFGTGTTMALLYRVVHGTPDLEHVPTTVRPLVERCLAKDAAQRPTAGGLLAEIGDLQPGGNWLPESLTRTFAAGAVPGTPSGSAFAWSHPGVSASGPVLAGSDPALAGSGPAAAASGPSAAAPGVVPGPELAATQTVGAEAEGSTRDNWPQATAGSALTATAGGMPPRSTPPLPAGSAYQPPPGAYQPPPGGRNRPGRRLWRPLVLAWIVGVLIALSGATAFALSSFTTGHTPSPDQSQQAPPPASTSGGPTGLSSSPSPSPSVSSSASTSPYGATSQPATTPSSPSGYTSTTPGTSTSTLPGTSTSTSPGTSTSTSPGTSTSTSPGTSTSTSPGTSTSTSPGTSTSTTPSSGSSSSAPASTSSSTSESTPASPSA